MEREHLKCFFQADVANGLSAIPLRPAHIYKTGFTTHIGQGLTGGPSTYSKGKDMITRLMLEPHAEPALDEAGGEDYVFRHFVDDDVRGARKFEDLFKFMWFHYCPRIL